jgi:hypothetical protein
MGRRRQARLAGVVLVLLVAVLALAAALLAGGSRLAQVRLRAVRLLVAAAVVQLGTSALAPDAGVARTTALVLTSVLVGLFVYGNWKVAGAPLIGVGLLLNVLVVVANGAMPVSVDSAARAGMTRAELGLPADAMREPLTHSTALGWLADIVPVALPWRSQVVSPGDVLVAAGVGLLLVSARGAQTPTRAKRSTVFVSESTTTGSYS